MLTLFLRLYSSNKDIITDKDSVVLVELTVGKNEICIKSSWNFPEKHKNIETENNSGNQIDTVLSFPCGIELTLFFQIFPFDSPENIRIPLVFWCFECDQKWTFKKGSEDAVLSKTITQNYHTKFTALV